MGKFEDVIKIAGVLIKEENLIKDDESELKLEDKEEENENDFKEKDLKEITNFAKNSPPIDNLIKKIKNI